MGKGKGTKTEQSQEIDPTMRAEAEKTSDLASLIAAMGFNPYKGNTTAAFTGQQEDAFRAAGQAADAFGMSNSVSGKKAVENGSGGKGGGGGGGANVDEFGMPVGTYDGYSGVKGYSAYETAGGPNMAGAEYQNKLDEFYASAGQKVEPRKPLVAGGGGKK